MIDFIFRYWLEILFTVITSSVICMFKEYMSLRNGLKALLRNELVRIYETYSKLGYCPSYMKENAHEIYTNYHQLNGNGYATSMINEIYRLPNSLKESDLDEKDFERLFSWQNS